MPGIMRRLLVTLPLAMLSVGCPAAPDASFDREDRGLGAGGGKAEDPADDTDDQRLPFYFSSQARLYPTEPGPNGLEAVGCGPKAGLFDRVRRVCVSEAGAIVPCAAHLRPMEIIEITDAATCEGRALRPGERYLADVQAVSRLEERVTPRGRVDLYDRDLHRIACADAQDSGFKVDELYPRERGPDGRLQPRRTDSGEPFGLVEGVVFLEPRSCDGQALEPRRAYYVRKALVDVVSPPQRPDPPGTPRWSDLRGSGDGCEGLSFSPAGPELSVRFDALRVARLEGPEPAEQARVCAVEATAVVPAGFRVAGLHASLSVDLDLGPETSARLTADVEGAGAFSPLALSLDRTGPASDPWVEAVSEPRDLGGCDGRAITMRASLRLTGAGTTAAEPPSGPGTYNVDVGFLNLHVPTAPCE